MNTLTEPMAWAYLQRAIKKRDGYWIGYWHRKWLELADRKTLHQRLKYDAPYMTLFTGVSL
jgi:hypothetical protein